MTSMGKAHLSSTIPHFPLVWYLSFIEHFSYFESVIEYYVGGGHGGLISLFPYPLPMPVAIKRMSSSFRLPIVGCEVANFCSFVFVFSQFRSEPPPSVSVWFRIVYWFRFQGYKELKMDQHPHFPFDLKLLIGSGSIQNHKIVDRFRFDSDS